MVKSKHHDVPILTGKCAICTFANANFYAVNVIFNVRPKRDVVVYTRQSWFFRRWVVNPILTTFVPVRLSFFLRPAPIQLAKSFTSHYLSLPSMKPHMNTALSMMTRLNRSSTRTAPQGRRMWALAVRLP